MFSAETMVSSLFLSQHTSCDLILCMSGSILLTRCAGAACEHGYATGMGSHKTSDFSRPAHPGLCTVPPLQSVLVWFHTAMTVQAVPCAFQRHLLFNYTNVPWSMTNADLACNLLSWCHPPGLWFSPLATSIPYGGAIHSLMCLRVSSASLQVLQCPCQKPQLHVMLARYNHRITKLSADRLMSCANQL